MNKPVNTFVVLSMLAGALAGVYGTAAADDRTMPSAGMMHGETGCPGYGTGMMGGMSHGMGMMGGGMGGFGPGMMGMGSILDLRDAQTAQLQKIQTDSMKTQRALMRRMWDEQEKLWDLMGEEKRSPAVIGKAYDKFADLQRQALEARIDAENKMTAVLTKEQQAQMRRGFRRGMMGY